jgi:hypothetical protein
VKYSGICCEMAQNNFDSECVKFSSDYKRKDLYWKAAEIPAGFVHHFGDEWDGFFEEINR